MRRGRFGKVAIIGLALVLTLALTGAGFAHWSQTIYIDATVETGSVDVCFSDGISNDDGIEQDLLDCSDRNPPNVTETSYIHVDPGDNGLDPSEWQHKGEVCARYNKDVANTEVSGAPCNKTLTVTLNNSYPCYHPTVFFSIDNLGTVPVDIESIKLTQVDYVDEYGEMHVFPVDQDLVACDTWIVDADTGNVHQSSIIPDEDDFTLHLSQLGVCNQIDPAGQIGDKVCGDLDIHVLQNQYNEGRSFSFLITIVATQWNEVTHPEVEKTISLPPGTVKLKLGAYTPGTLGTYFDIILSNVPTGYSVGDGTWPGWCFDEHIYIYPGTTYDVTLYSSYDPLLPAHCQDEDWDKVNYMINHKDPLATWDDIQAAIWYFINSGAYPSDPEAASMVDDANANGDGYVPGTGDWIAVICDMGSRVQGVFIEVDP